MISVSMIINSISIIYNIVLQLTQQIPSGPQNIKVMRSGSPKVVSISLPHSLRKVEIPVPSHLLPSPTQPIPSTAYSVQALQIKQNSHSLLLILLSLSARENTILSNISAIIFLVIAILILIVLKCFKSRFQVVNMQVILLLTVSFLR